MCDYSLENRESRPAVISDRLVTTSFRCSPTRGFASQVNLSIPVCVRPGTELAFDKPVRYDRKLFRRFSGAKVANGTVARFVQINKDNPHTHHDALEFPDGTVVALTRLVQGQWATVLQLPVKEALKHASEGAGLGTPAREVDRV